MIYLRTITIFAIFYDFVGGTCGFFSICWGFVGDTWLRTPMEPRHRWAQGSAMCRLCRHLARGASARYDAILLDVDNGPDGIVRGDNDRLYTRTGLAKARDALNPGGILAVWSAAPDPAFTRRLKEAGFRVEAREVRARPNNKGPRHTIWFASI